MITLDDDVIYILLQMMCVTFVSSDIDLDYNITIIISFIEFHGIPDKWLSNRINEFVNCLTNYQVGLQ